MSTREDLRYDGYREDDETRGYHKGCRGRVVSRRPTWRDGPDRRLSYLYCLGCREDVSDAEVTQDEET